MESAFCIMDNRCATIKHVLPTIIFSRASWTRFSEALSSALVALVHSLLFFLLCIFFYSIFSLSLLLAHSLTQFCHTALSPQSHLLGLTSFSHFIKWPNGLSLLFLSPFLLFFLPHSSLQITINASHLLWLYFNQNLLFFCSLDRMAFVSFFSFSFSVSNTPKPTNPITHADFCTW